MALVIGHSQTKYLSDYLNVEDYSVFSYPGYRTSQFMDESVVFEVSSYFSVSNCNIFITLVHCLNLYSHFFILPDILYLLFSPFNSF